jgi:tetratricopeptide (TPR) repeat protein
MKNAIVLLLMVFGLYSCAPPKYIIERHSTAEKQAIDSSIVNYIPLADEDLNQSRILDSTMILLEANEFSKLDRYITSLEASGIISSDLYLSKTLLLITRKDYSAAISSLGKIKDSDYSKLRRLLSIDLTYELAKTSGLYDYYEFLRRYQDLIDAYPDDISLKKVVVIRMRHILILITTTFFSEISLYSPITFKPKKDSEKRK